jgi:homoserine kinase type II
MNVLYVLWHSYLPDRDIDRDEEKFIGIYSTEEKAKAAIEQLRTQPGFGDYPDGFEIHPQQVDVTSWDEGFIRARGDEEPEQEQ